MGFGMGFGWDGIWDFPNPINMGGKYTHETRGRFAIIAHHVDYFLSKILSDTQFAIANC